MLVTVPCISVQEIRASVVRFPIVVDDEGGRRGSQAGNGRLLEGEAACGRTGGVRGSVGGGLEQVRGNSGGYPGGWRNARPQARRRSVMDGLTRRVAGVVVGAVSLGGFSRGRGADSGMWQGSGMHR